MKKIFLLFVLLVLQAFAYVSAMSKTKVKFEPNKSTLIQQINTTIGKNQEPLYLKTGHKIEPDLAKTVLNLLKIHYGDSSFHHLIIQLQNRHELQGRGETFLESFGEKVEKEVGHVENLRTILKQLFLALTFCLQDSVTNTYIIEFKYPFKKDTSV